jgi:hypothetical protein
MYMKFHKYVLENATEMGLPRNQLPIDVRLTQTPTLRTPCKMQESVLKINDMTERLLECPTSCGSIA